METEQHHLTESSSDGSLPSLEDVDLPLRVLTITDEPSTSCTAAISGTNLRMESRNRESVSEPLTAEPASREGSTPIQVSLAPGLADSRDKHSDGSEVVSVTSLPENKLESLNRPSPTEEISEMLRKLDLGAHDSSSNSLETDESTGLAASRTVSGCTIPSPETDKFEKTIPSQRPSKIVLTSDEFQTCGHERILPKHHEDKSSGPVLSPLESCPGSTSWTVGFTQSSTPTELKELPPLYINIPSIPAEVVESRSKPCKLCLSLNNPALPSTSTTSPDLIDKQTELFSACSADTVGINNPNLCTSEHPPITDEMQKKEDLITTPEYLQHSASKGEQASSEVQTEVTQIIGGSHSTSVCRRKHIGSFGVTSKTIEQIVFSEEQLLKDWSSEKLQHEETEENAGEDSTTNASPIEESDEKHRSRKSFSSENKHGEYTSSIPHRSEVDSETEVTFFSETNEPTDLAEKTDPNLESVTLLFQTEIDVSHTSYLETSNASQSTVTKVSSAELRDVNTTPSDKSVEMPPCSNESSDEIFDKQMKSKSSVSSSSSISKSPKKKISVRSTTSGNSVSPSKSNQSSSSVSSRTTNLPTIPTTSSDTEYDVPSISEEIVNENPPVNEINVVVPEGNLGYVIPGNVNIDQPGDNGDVQNVGLHPNPHFFDALANAEQNEAQNNHNLEVEALNFNNMVLHIDNFVPLNQSPPPPDGNLVDEAEQNPNVEVGDPAPQDNGNGQPVNVPIHVNFLEFVHPF